MQRHLALLQSRNGNRLVNRLLVALGLGLSWYVPGAGTREQWVFSFAVHVVAFVVLLNWRIGDQRMSMELALLERSLSGEGTSFKVAEAELWEDQYVSFRAKISRAYQNTSVPYKFFAEIPLWTYLTLLSLLGRVLALTGRFPFAH